jgi:Ca2+-binding RTX toxin-like protein
VDLTGMPSVHSLNDVLTHATQVGANTVINFGSGDTLTLINITEANLTASDFLFAPSPTNPDLTATNLILSDTTVSYHINDIGTGAAAASTTGIYLSSDSTITTADTLLSMTSTPSLAANGSDIESALLAFPGNLAPGTYYVGVIADYNGQIAESSEANNASSAAAVILGNDSDNTLMGTAGNDTIFGLAGNDAITSGAGNDHINGGDGIDTAVYSGNLTNYAVTFDGTALTFTVADQRVGAPDGTDTVTQVETLQFADGASSNDSAGRLTLTVNNPDGTHSVTSFDTAATAPWASQTSAYDTQGSLASQTINEDYGTHWTNVFDTTGTSGWTWYTNAFDGNGNLASQTGLNDDGTHWLTLYDVNNAYSWSNATIGYDADWNQTSLTGTRDDGSHTLSMSDLTGAFDTLTWFTTPYDANWTSSPVDTVLTGGAGKDVLYGHAGNDTINGGPGVDLLAGGDGNDTFVFHVGEANGDTVLDFDAHGETDHLQLTGYGTGATFTQNDATHWQVNYNGGTSHEVITFSNGPTIHPSDYLFV